MPLLYGFDDELDVLLEVLSEELPDELSALPLSGSPVGLPEDVPAEELPIEAPILEELEELDVLDELEELVVVELELFVELSSLPELLQPPSKAVIIKAERITESFFFMTSPLL